MTDCSSPLYTSSGKLYPNDQELTYEKAAEYCEDRGLYLAAIRSESALDEINKFAAKCGHHTDNWQVGLKMNGQSGEWADGSTYISPGLFRNGEIVEYWNSMCRVPNLRNSEKYSRLESSARSTGCYSDYRFFCSDVGKTLSTPEALEDLDIFDGSYITIVVVVSILMLILSIGCACFRRYMIMQRTSQMSSAAVQMSAVQAAAAQAPPPPPPMQGYYPAPQMGATSMQGYQPAPQMAPAPMQGYQPAPQMATAPPYQPVPQMGTAPVLPYQPAPEAKPPSYEATQLM